MEIKEFYERYWELIKYRNEFNIPKTVLKAWDDEETISKTDSFKLLARHIKKYNKPLILDIGAGNRRLKDTIGLMEVDFEYSSLDISKNIQHDYTDINKVNKKFDIITMFELIEHLSLAVTLQYFTKAFESLNPNGILIVSTPNIDHINQLWKHDVTHIQQYPIKDIYSILRMIGFSNKMEVYRINLQSPKMTIKRRIIERLRVLLNKILGTDYAHGVLIISQKNVI